MTDNGNRNDKNTPTPWEQEERAQKLANQSKVALTVIRKSYTKASRAERMQKKQDDILQAMASPRKKKVEKPGNPFTVTPASLSSHKLDSILTKGSANMKMLEEKPPLRFKNISEMKNDAKYNYSLKMSIRKLRNGDGTRSSQMLGKPRPIYVEAVAKICEIAEKELAQDAAKKKKQEELAAEKKEMLKRLRPISAPVGARGMALLAKERRESNFGMGAQRLDNNNAYDDIVDDDSNDSNNEYDHYGSNHGNSRDDLRLHRERPNTSHAQTHTNTHSHSHNHNHNDMMKTSDKRRTSSLIDEKIHKVQEFRRLLQEKEEQERIAKAKEKKRLKYSKLEWEAYVKRQKHFMIIVNTLRFVAPYHDMIKKRRKDIFDRLHVNKSSRAVKIIEGWWWKAYIILKLKRLAHRASLIRLVARRAWCKIQLKKHKDGVELIKQFIKDCRGLSDKVRKIYRYRTKIKMIQRAVREWMKCQHARIHIMWLYMEKLVKKRAEEYKIARKRNEIHALKTLATIEGFGNTMVEIKKVQKQINEQLEHEKRMMSRVLRDQANEDREFEDIFASIHNNTKMHESHDSDSDDDPALRSPDDEILGVQNELLAHKHHHHVTKAIGHLGTASKKGIKQKHVAWYSNIKKNPANAGKLKLLHQVLGAQRRAFYARCDREERSSFLEPANVDMKKLKEFLRHPTENNSVNPIKIGDKAVRRRRPLFLLLTQGGIQALQSITTEQWTKRQNASMLGANNDTKLQEFLKNVQKQHHK